MPNISRVLADLRDIIVNGVCTLSELRGWGTGGVIQYFIFGDVRSGKTFEGKER